MTNTPQTVTTLFRKFDVQSVSITKGAKVVRVRIPGIGEMDVVILCRVSVAELSIMNMNALEYGVSGPRISQLFCMFIQPELTIQYPSEMACSYGLLARDPQ